MFQGRKLETFTEFSFTYFPPLAASESSLPACEEELSKLFLILQSLADLGGGAKTYAPLRLIFFIFMQFLAK